MTSLFSIPAELPLPEEFSEILARSGEIVVERIISHGHTTPPGAWFDQDLDEWVALLQGEALLSFSDGSTREMHAGESTLIPAHCRHRVGKTPRIHRVSGLHFTFHHIVHEAPSMSQSISSLFSATDHEHITAAVRQAETKTSGEIVPYVVGQSDSYEEAEWRCGALLGAATLAAFSIIYSYTSIWLPLSVAELVIAALLAGGLGILLTKLFPALKRLFAGDALMERRVAQRAAEAFVSEEVFKTRDRTGILIFLSILEHKVFVLGDSGINAKVKQDDWNDVVKRIVSGIRSRKLAEGLIDGITQCGVLLQRHGVTIRPDDTDELPDTLRTNDK